MKTITKKLLITFLTVIALGFTFQSSTSAQKQEANSTGESPTLVGEGYEISGKAGNDNDETPGEWYVGNTPANVLPDSPVLLFVHGLNSKAQVWWEGNDMYDTAFQAGYETAFIQLHDAGGASATMWDNGLLLAEKIEEISNHFNGKDITIVAHSKGGVDTQAALTHYDAWQYVDNVITLGSPHHGSQLADLAYSAWAGWLADLIGMKGEGTESMQMGYMEHFRSETDSHPSVYKNNYYTMGGTGWGSIFSSNWFGGMYLSSYGQNDGVVTVASSRLPSATEIAIDNWNHTEIRTGTTFSTFQSYLSEGLTANSYNLVNNYTEEKNAPRTNQLVRGGPLQVDEPEKVLIPLENDMEQLTLSLLAAEDLFSARLIDPSGKIVYPNIKQDSDIEDYFTGAITYELTVPNAKAGEWVLELHSKTNNAYLLTTHFDTAEKVKFYREKVSNKAIYRLLPDQTQINPKSLKATYRMSSTTNPAETRTWTITGNQTFSQNLMFNENELYNITIDIEGETKSGNKFERTIIDSVYIK